MPRPAQAHVTAVRLSSKATEFAQHQRRVFGCWGALVFGHNDLYFMKLLI